MSASAWAQPVGATTIAAARAGFWDVLLTPKTPVPKAWLSDIRGKNVLCLASGGGQQVPIFAAAGAVVVSFDLSDEQLRKDQLVAAREGLNIQCVRGDMANLGQKNGSDDSSDPRANDEDCHDHRRGHCTRCTAVTFYMADETSQSSENLLCVGAGMLSFGGD